MFSNVEVAQAPQIAVDAPATLYSALEIDRDQLDRSPRALRRSGKIRSSELDAGRQVR